MGRARYQKPSATGDGEREREGVGDRDRDVRAAPVAVKSINQQHHRINSVFGLVSQHARCVLVVNIFTVCSRESRANFM